MPKVIVDVTNVPDSDRATYAGPTPNPGLYKMLFKRAWWTKTKDGKKSMLKVLFIADTENEAKKQFNGYPVFHNVTYEPSTAWKMKELFTALRAGLKAGIDYDDKGDVTRIGRAVPGKTWVLMKGKDKFWSGKRDLEVDTLAPIPLPDGQDEDDIIDMEADAMEATDYSDAGGVDPSTAVDPDAGAGDGGEMPEDPWAAPGASDPTSGAVVDDEPPF